MRAEGDLKPDLVGMSTGDPDDRFDRFEPGDRVRVRAGPFQDFEGVVEQIDKQKGTALLTVTILGRQTPIMVESWQVERL